MKHLRFALIAILISVGCDNATREVSEPAMKDGTSAVDRDNSAVNRRDRDTNAKTPFDQNENQDDINITAGIRKRVVDTKMSINAQNVKIITQNGTVTLRGPVKSEEEKKQIEEIARGFAGVKTVDSQLEVEKNL